MGMAPIAVPRGCSSWPPVWQAASPDAQLCSPPKPALGCYASPITSLDLRLPLRQAWRQHQVRGGPHE
eukprot:scaffold46186_cov17-Prasinocladus_malaysianus.AAC.1